MPPSTIGSWRCGPNSSTPEARASGLAGVVISALEGAIIMSRARRDLQFLDLVVEELSPLLDGAALGVS